MANSTHIARTMMRAWFQVRRARGVLWAESQRNGDGREDRPALYLLSQPSWPEESLEQLLYLLLQPHPHRREVAAQMGAREVLRIDGTRIGKFRFNLRQLDDRKTLQQLVDDGVTPLHRLAEEDIERELDSLTRYICQLEAKLASGEGPVLPSLSRSADGGAVHLESYLARIRFVLGSHAAERARELFNDYRNLAHHRTTRTIPHVVSLLHTVACDRSRGVPPRKEEHREALRSLLNLPTSPQSRAIMLADMALQMLDRRIRSNLPSAHAISQELSFGARDLVVATRELGDALLKHQQPWSRPAIDDRTLTRLAQVAIRHPKLNLRLPAGTSRRTVHAVARLAIQRASDGLEAVWNTALETEQSCNTLPLGNPQISADLLVEVLREQLPHWPPVFDDNTLRRYLRAHRALKESGVNSDRVDLPTRLAHSRSEPNQLLSVLMANIGSDAALPMVLELAGELMGNPGHPALGPVRHYQEDPPELTAEERQLVVRLDLHPGKARRYLHLRQVVGMGRTFSEQVRQPLEQEQKDRTEAKTLARRIEDMPAARKASVQRRLAMLQDPEARRSRVQQAVSSARASFQRGLKELETSALQSTLDQAACSLLEHWLGRSVSASPGLWGNSGDGPSRSGLRNAVLLLGTRHVIPDQARAFFTLALDETVPCVATEIQRTKPNRRFTLEMADRGIDVARWLQGFSATCTINGEPIHFATEQDPLEVLKMGSLFETCLSLGDINGASCLSNALDVNKQVIYGRRNDGTLVARKLIGVTDEGELVGYRTYAHLEVDEVRGELNRALVEWGRSLGLTPADQGTPRQLIGGFWYDDGNERWTHQEDEKTVEELYLAGFDNPACWRVGAALSGPFADAARARLYARCEVDGPRPSPQLMVSLRQFTWLSRLPPSEVWMPLCDMAAILPDEASVVRAFCDRAHKLRVMKHTPRILPHMGFLRSLPFEEAVDELEWWMGLFEDARVACLIEDHTRCWQGFENTAAAALCVSWKRGPDELSLARARRRADNPHHVAVLDGLFEADPRVLRSDAADEHQWQLECGPSVGRWARLLDRLPAQAARIRSAARPVLSPVQMTRLHTHTVDSPSSAR